MIKATLSKESVLKTLNRISKSMQAKNNFLGAQQGMSDLNSMCNICSADDSSLKHDFKEEMIMEGIDCRSDIIANLDHAIIGYTCHHCYKYVLRHAREAQRISKSNFKWFNYDLTKSGLKHTPTSVARVQKIIDGLKEDVKD